MLHTFLAGRALQHELRSLAASDFQNRLLRAVFRVENIIRTDLLPDPQPLFIAFQAD
jgi:hypothetical protein